MQLVGHPMKCLLDCLLFFLSLPEVPYPFTFKATNIAARQSGREDLQFGPFGAPFVDGIVFGCDLYWAQLSFLAGGLFKKGPLRWDL